MIIINSGKVPVTSDGRVNWKEYFVSHAKVGDEFIVPKTMRSGIQRQAQDCGFCAHSSTVDELSIRIVVNERKTVARKVLQALDTLTEKQLLQIHAGCVQAGILPPLY
jgi:hypothetical protein